MTDEKAKTAEGAADGRNILKRYYTERHQKTHQKKRKHKKNLTYQKNPQV